jgi:hypothetical protein
MSLDSSGFQILGVVLMDDKNFFSLFSTINLWLWSTVNITFDSTDRVIGGSSFSDYAVFLVIIASIFSSPLVKLFAISLTSLLRLSTIITIFVQGLNRNNRDCTWVTSSVFPELVPFIIHNLIINKNWFQTLMSSTKKDHSENRTMNEEIKKCYIINGHLANVSVDKLGDFSIEL